MTEVLVLGAGSIGLRHARNLAAAGADVIVTDPNPHRADPVVAAGASWAPFDAAWNRSYGGIIVASPTSHHCADAQRALEHADRVLVEKPLALPSDDLTWLDEVGSRIAVGCNLRFHAPIERLVDLVATGRAGTVRSLRLWFGSWLPDWRQHVDYRSTYSAHKALGGGVLLDAIHELDLLLWLCGDLSLDVVGAIVDRVGPLEIDVEDTVVALVRRSDGAVATLSLDYLSRRYRRGIEVVGQEATVRLDWNGPSLVVEDGTGTTTLPAGEPVAASYERQDAAFVRWVDGGPPLPVGAHEGRKAVELAHAIAEVAGWE